MNTQPQRSASGASIRLTRKDDLNGRHLLSTFNKKPKSSASAEESPKAETIQRREREPSIDAEPLSTEDEASEEEKPPSSDNDRRPTLEEKLAAASKDGVSSPVSRSSARQKSYIKKGGLARTSSMMTGDDEDDDPFAWSHSSQSSKRAKQNTFIRNKPSFSKIPTSSARSAPTPEKPSPKNSEDSAKTSTKKKRKSKKEDKPSEDSGSDKDTFKVPLDIHVSSPVKPKSKASKKSDDAAPKFKMPPSFDDISYSSFGASSRDAQLATMDLSSASSLSTALSSPVLSSSEDDQQRKSDIELLALNRKAKSPSPPRKALCPMCKAEVDPEMLRQFEAQPKQRLREQQRFCASHKADSATKEWQAQGYPEIDWNNFEERLQGHYSALEKYLNVEAPSYYRNILDSAQKSGQSLRLSLAGDGIEHISCGYYGTKGAQKMLDAVMDRFSVKLRRLAKDDSLVTKVGVVGYAQSVLVPELAIRLIMEDMNVQADRAREVMRESIAIGQEVNPQQDDVVPVVEEPDDYIMV